MPPKTYHFYVYILANPSRTLYVGITNNLLRRVTEHKALRANTFTARYKITRLVHYEHFQYAPNAIAREKELKDESREKKLVLVEQNNPTWQDLSESW